MNLEAIFFDAGGTLVFPDPQLTLAPLMERGVTPTQEQLFVAERDAKQQLDAAHAHGIEGVDARYWQLYYDRLLRELAIDAVPVRDALVAATRAGINWRTLKPGTREALERLHRRYRLAVISNSDGSIARLMEELGIADLFDSVTDSHHCAAEKPDARIFRAAMASLGAVPEHSLYVGDIYSVDFLGARGVGIQPLLMDPAAVYRDTPYPRVETVDQVERWISTHNAK